MNIARKSSENHLQVDIHFIKIFQQSVSQQSDLLGPCQKGRDRVERFNYLTKDGKPTLIPDYSYK